jgi:DNA polymerase-3 subunit chi
VTEVLFYQLDRQPLEQVLPGLVEKCRERSWRVVVQATSEERVEALDAQLWTYRDEAFLAHGTRRDGNAALQPVWLTSENENPNGATVRFLVDGAEPETFGGFDRVVFLFDGKDPAALDRARAAWKTARAEGHTATYWQQAANGRWEEKK